ncbi:MAG: hydrolase [Leuconostoc mesenteroides]|uniref:hydrolase n=1 Tax=Leuconostoc mesenteroides TaxID=1245 RepID=UPI0009FE1258|nr:hydrolase [Leuconostoc mesenteroides]MCP9301973.1 hydrolase [Leuconostoc mesenteroides]MCP9326488.1 hydrolase [Leuconostoc mesenteroides]ORI80569.1 hydrolase [Leuconostoc mesenteroides subsp. mesenteroides]
MTDSQTVLQPELINRLDSKIMYLGQLQSAVMNQQVPQVYELLDSKKFNEQIRQRPHADSNALLAQMVTDIHDNLAIFLAPELLKYLKQQFSFFDFVATSDEPSIYQVYIGTWWDHRQFAILDVLSLTLTINKKIVSEWQETIKLPTGANINDIQIREIKQITNGLQTFLDDETKRNLEVQVLNDQLAQLKENKSGLLGRTDKKAREELENKRDLLLASQQRVPEVKAKLAEHESEMLQLEKDDALRHLEIEEILSHFDDIDAFIQKVDHLYVNYLKTLLQKK